MGYLIGADIGSQSVKAVLLDPEGQTVGSAGRPCVMQHPGKRATWGGLYIALGCLTALGVTALGAITARALQFARVS